MVCDFLQLFGRFGSEVCREAILSLVEDHSTTA
jgi:hypothetical protein